MAVAGAAAGAIVGGVRGEQLAAQGARSRVPPVDRGPLPVLLWLPQRVQLQAPLLPLLEEQ